MSRREVRLTPDQQSLAVGSLRRARALTRRILRRWHDEWERTANYAAVVAAGEFRPDLGVPFDAYLPIVAKREAVEACRVIAKQSRREWRVASPDHIEDQRSGRDIDHVVADDELRWLMRRLPAPQRRAIEAVYLDGMRQCDYADQIGVCESAVTAILKSAMQRMRDAAEELRSEARRSGGKGR